ENAFHFEQHVLAISTPDDPKYGQHMSREDLKAMLRPSPDASMAILAWLRAEGVSSASIEDQGDWINFYVSASEANRILDTKFHYYTNANNGVKRIRTLQYSVPQKLHQYIHMIQPTTRFGQVASQRNTIFQHFEIGESKGSMARYPGNSLNVTFCNTTITPQCLRDLYNIGNFRGTAKNGTVVLLVFVEYPSLIRSRQQDRRMRLSRTVRKVQRFLQLHCEIYALRSEPKLYL
ncbi:MAG: hypothetical protein Q9198_011198, partial [Flavoplaca austrocitrina]